MDRNNKRKDKTKSIKSKTPAYQQREIDEQKAMEKGGLNDSILILVEGPTEEVYFTGLKNNSLLKNQLSGVVVVFLKKKEVNPKNKSGIEPLNDIRTMIWYAMEEHKKNKYDQIWLVFDNDKRNAFILDTTSFQKIQKALPKEIADKIKSAFDANEDTSSYFLSIHDYIEWLNSVLGANDTITYWDSIQFCTQKGSTFEEYEDSSPYALFGKNELFYDKNKKEYTNINLEKAKEFDVFWKKYVRLAYSCISFEFWLLLHFEQNKMPFLWVEKEKDESIDVVTYFKNHHRPNYGKGKNINCDAYTCLANNHQSINDDDERKILLRVIEAYKNTQWLKNEMQPILQRQNNRWHEINPYIKGLDILVAELLNIKEANQLIVYSGWNIEFSFDANHTTLTVKITTTDFESVVISEQSTKGCFDIISSDNTKKEPVAVPTVSIDMDKPTATISIPYNIPEELRKNLVLRFKDPRSKSKSPILLVLLDKNAPPFQE